MAEGRPLRIAVLTQEDPFYIPANVEMLCRDPGFDVREIVVLDARGSLANMRGRLLRWFGPAACARLAARLAAGKAREAVNRATGYRLPGRPTSLRAVARRYRIPFAVEANANAAPLLERLRGHDLDVIVSFSAPQVFRAELLRLPRLGCVNLHCSLLPHYRGLLPSFWVLYHGEPRSGATVHFMDAEIDNGALLRQAEVPLDGARSMDQVLALTKRRGGELMVEALRELAAGTARPLPNPVEEGSYFTWPTDQEARTFRAKGYRLA